MSLMFCRSHRLARCRTVRRIALYDALGRSIWSGTRIDRQDLSALPVGTYLLHVRNNGEERVFPHGEGIGAMPCYPAHRL